MADSLIKTPADLSNPRDAKFTAKTPAVGAGASGADTLVTQPDSLYCPANVVSSSLKPAKNSNEQGTSLSQAVSVDFGTGTHSSPDQKR